MMTVQGVIAELQNWPQDAKIIVTLEQGDKVPRRFEIDELSYEEPVCPDSEDIGEIIILESGEF